ncbi:uncharacterized protein LOC34617493 [Cyclospora cayetanensis]|uniref:Uncharacterized protein LOC34617493 n=1 Tax=Cyclospora cayetanensis TaxID=88456 RepID=A0A6P6RTN5_9EIME|nr:uncharacterized protein LOC34617493 [Cyclospora cayetanensis]
MGKAPRRSPPDEAYQEGPLLAPCESEKAETISTGADGETSRREPPSQPRLLSSLLPAAALPSASRSRWLEETSRAELVRSTAFLASARSAAEGAVSAFGDGSLAWRLLRSSAALLPPGLYGGGSLLGSQTLHHEAAVPSIAASAAKITEPTQEPRAAAAPPTAQDTPDYLECCHAVPRRSSSTAFLPESFSVDAPGCAPDTATSVSLTSAAGASAFVAFLPGAAASTAVTPVAADGLNDAAATAAIRAVADVEDLGNGGCLPWEPSVHEPSDDNCKNSSFTDTADGSEWGDLWQAAAAWADCGGAAALGGDSLLLAAELLKVAAAVAAATGVRYCSGLAIRLKHEQQVQSKLKQQKEKERQRLQQQGRRQHEVRLLAAAAARLCLKALAATERSLRLATDLVGELSCRIVFRSALLLAKWCLSISSSTASRWCCCPNPAMGAATSNISPFPPLLVLPPLPVRQKNREMLLLLYHQQQQERLPKRAAPPHLPSYCETSKASFVTGGLPVRLTKHLVPSANDGSEIPKASCPIPHEFPITSIGRSSERLSQQGATADCSCRFCSAAEGYLPGAFPWLGGSSIAASLCSFNSGKNSVRGLSRDPFDSGEDVGLLDYKLVLDRAEMLLTLVAEQIAAAAIAQTSQASACGSSIQANEPSTDSWAPKCHIRKGAQLNTPGSPDSTIVRIPGFLEAAAVAPNPSLTDAAAMYISVGDSAAAAVEAAADLNVAPILCSGVSLRLVASRVLLEFLEGANACTQLRFKVAELTKWLDHLRLVSKELSDQYQQ